MTTNSKRIHVIALKEEDFELLSVLGSDFDVKFIPTLECKATNIKPSFKSGNVIVTSSRALDFVDLPDECVVFVVGNSTKEKVLKQKPRATVLGEHTGNGANLAAYILETAEKGTEFTWITSSDRRSDISDLLPPTMSLSISEVYSVDTILDPVVPDLSNEVVTFLILYSKHGIPTAKKLISSSDCKCVIVAIGNTTATTCSDNGLQVDVIAAVPNVRGVADAIKSYSR